MGSSSEAVLPAFTGRKNERQRMLIRTAQILGNEGGIAGRFLDESIWNQISSMQGLYEAMAAYTRSKFNRTKD